MQNQVAAMKGDPEALSDYRALIKRLKHKRYKQDRSRRLITEQNMKTKTMLNRVLTGAAALALLVGGGCGSPGSGVQPRLSPLAAQYLTTAAVMESVKKNEPLRKRLALLQPIICAVATKRGVTPDEIILALPDRSEDMMATVNLAMAIYVSAIAPDGTNAPAVNPYSDAIFCKGFANGLAPFPPRFRSRNDPPATVKWPRLK